jgi:hypothetical protein
MELHNKSTAYSSFVGLISERLLSATAQSITGTGGGGSSSNQGLRIDRGSARATAGSAIFMGQALGTTSIKGNNGVVIQSATISSSVDATVTGTGGGGTGGLNHGIFMNGIIGIGGAITSVGTAGTGPGSLDKKGDFFSS